MAATDRLALLLVRRPSLVAVALGLNLAVTLPLAYALNIWQDEAYTLNTIGGSLGNALHQSLAFEQNAPLYFLILTLWRHVNASIFFLRLFSVMCAAGTIALVPALARRYVPQVDPGFITLAVAWNPFLIWAAVEMRVYAMIVFLSALLMFAYFEAFFAPIPRKFALSAFAACVTIALYTQYYFAFLIAAQGIALLFYRRTSLWRYLLACFAAGVAFLPMIVIVPGQVQNFRSGFAPPPTVAHSTLVVASIVARYIFPLMIPHAKIAYALLTAALVVGAVAARHVWARSGDGLALFVTVVTALLFAIGAYATGVHLLNRHLASIYVPAMLSTFAAITFLRPPQRRIVCAAWLAIALLASTIVLVQTYAPLAKPGDWIRTNGYISSHETRGEPIAVFEAENALPFAFYYRGPNRIVAIPHAVDFRRYDVTRFVLRNEHDLAASFPRARRVWLITAGECASANITFGCDVLERFVAQRYRVVSDASFYESRARLLDLVKR